MMRSPSPIRRAAPAFMALFAAILLAPAPALADRVRDLGAFQGVRTNQLTGYGVVVGLAGTGDDNLEYITQAMRGVSGRLGVQLPQGIAPGLKNAAAVLITADLPAFAKPGQRIDVTVSTIGKAKSLRGGALIMAPLYGADGQIYAMAQGNLAVGGLGVTAKDGSQLTVNVPTVGRIAEGASVERAVATGFDSQETLRWNLFTADFLTASRVRDAINARFPGSATVEDGITLAMRLPASTDARATMMASIEMIEVTPAETAARVIVNSRTGTVVINRRGAPFARRDQPRQAGGQNRRKVPGFAAWPAQPRSDCCHAGQARSRLKSRRPMSRCSSPVPASPALSTRSTSSALPRQTLSPFSRRSSKQGPSGRRWKSYDTARPSFPGNAHRHAPDHRPRAAAQGSAGVRSDLRAPDAQRRARRQPWRR